jgi:hypothetical protein
MSDLRLRLSDGGADDLPRTLRREREARERAAQAAASAAYRADDAGWGAGNAAQPAVVTAFNVPFLRLMVFCIKLVLAAVPALILLTALLWLAGEVLITYFPWLVKVQVVIRVPD